MYRHCKKCGTNPMRKTRVGAFVILADCSSAPLVLLEPLKVLQGGILGVADEYIPQSFFLGLLGTGDGGCVASQGCMALEGRVCSFLWCCCCLAGCAWISPDYLLSAPSQIPNRTSSICGN